MHAFCCGSTSIIDGRFAGALVAIALAGVVRGASGFGQALVFVPLAGLFYPPAAAVPMLWVVDAIGTPLLLRPHLRGTDWREVLLLVAGGAAALPAGVWLLTQLDPIVMRWVICSLVLVCTAALAFGWSVAVPETAASNVMLGILSGLGGGATGMSGPPLILTWLGRRTTAARIRSNIFVYLWLLGFASLAAGAANGLLTRVRLLEGLALAPCYAAAMFAGSFLFHHAGRLAPERREMLFRHLALWLCAASACAGLPLWR